MCFDVFTNGTAIIWCILDHIDKCYVKYLIENRVEYDHHKNWIFLISVQQMFHFFAFIPCITVFINHSKFFEFMATEGYLAAVIDNVNCCVAYDSISVTCQIDQSSK